MQITVSIPLSTVCSLMLSVRPQLALVRFLDSIVMEDCFEGCNHVSLLNPSL